jgi:hypothetical protein
MAAMKNLFRTFIQLDLLGRTALVTSPDLTTTRYSYGKGYDANLGYYYIEPCVQDA